MQDRAEQLPDEMLAALDRRRMIGVPIVLAATLLFYGITLSRVPIPGDSINNLLLFLRLTPVDTFRNPIWFLVGRAVLAVVPGSPLIVLHGLNALFGAACVALMFWFMSGVPHNRTAEEKVRHVRPLMPQLVTGGVSALVLALCTPFWFAAVRAYAQIFHVFLVLLLVLLLRVYQRAARFSCMALFAFLYGVTLVESAVLVLLAPLYLVATVALLWQNKQLKVRYLAALLIAFLTGFGVVLLQAWLFLDTTTFVWREFRGYGHVLGVILNDHYRLAIGSVPRVGWLTIGLFSVLPWLFLVPFPRVGAMKKKSFISSYVLSLLFTVFGVAVLANQPMAPWRQFGLTPLVIVPYAFVASWMGYLAGYWYIVLSRSLRAGGSGSSRFRQGLRRLYLAGVAVALVGMAWSGYRDVSDRRGRPAMDLARDVVASLDGRQWLVTNGAIDGLIRYAAFEAGVPLQLLNVSLAQAPFHRKYVASLLSDSRLRSLALVGLGPLLDEWIEKRDDVTQDLAILTHADLWQSKGIAAVPHGALFLGAREPGLPDGLELVRLAEPIWRRRMGGLDAVREAVNPLASYNEWVFSHYSKVANNLGVYLEDQGASEEALEAYQAALGIDPGNISALLNAYTLTQGQETDVAREIAARVQAFEQGLDKKLRVWALAYHYGYVRHPMAFLEMGWSWAMTGKAGAAIRDFERAAQLSGSRSHLQMALAALYFREGRDMESEQAYFALLVENPDNTAAIMGLARLAMRQGQYDQARAYLARLLDLKVPADVVEFELASLEILSGNLPLAISILERLAEKYPEHLRAPAMLALIEMDRGDEEALVRHVTRLEKAKDAPPAVKLILAFVALRESRNDKARQHLEDLVRVQPDHTQALEMLVKIDMAEGRQKEAEDRIAQIYAADVNNAFANLALGSLQYVRGEFDLAESSFLASIEREPTSDALNSLAWVYMSQNRHEDAQRYAARAVRADAGNFLAWDTLGESSLQLGNLDLAERALVRASELAPDSPRVLFHLAQLYEARGEISKARALAQDLQQLGSLLPTDLYDDILNFLQRLR